MNMDWLMGLIVREWSREAIRRRACAPRQPPPEEFTRGISAADRVVFTDECAAIASFAGAEAQTIVKGFCTAQRDDRHLSECFSFVVDFYLGSRLLDSVRFGATRFVVGEAKYAIERGGEVAALFKRMWADPESYRAWTDTFAERVLKKPGCADLQAWS